MPRTALLYDPATQTWLQFDKPLKTFTTALLSEIPVLLAEIELAVEQQTRHAIGFVSYEASPAFEPTAETQPAGEFPLLWFGLFDAPRQVPSPVTEADQVSIDWRPSLDENGFCRAVEQIKTAIAAGETYQVNFTFPLTASDPGDPWSLFCRLMQNQPDSFGTWIDTGRYVIASASPEIFFERRGAKLLTKPMKGTTTRGLTQADDQTKADMLQVSVKERAENIMVLDMIRNDLARLSGKAVEVEALCSIEKHPTVWQMTSTASTVTDTSLLEIFTALFPCASITGAPKLRTMHHIAALETTPRQIYTGVIGHIAPNRQTRFSVAIRTALIDRETKTATYGIGAGITWDSDPATEYRECLAKAQILHQICPPFALLESLLWEPGSGYYLLDEHLQRLQSSASYFGFSFDQEQITEKLQQLTADLSPAPHKIRLLLDQAGMTTVETAPITSTQKSVPLRVCLAKTSIARSDPFLYHKTTNRTVYATARQGVDDYDEALLYNDKGEVTEACNANLVVRLDGELVTPPIGCGLLAGTLRSHLLATGEIREQIIHLDDLSRCTELYLINSVRRWQRMELVGF